MKLTQEKLKKILYYNKKTGFFGVKNQFSVIMLSDPNITDCLRVSKYWLIRIEGKQYSAHRLAWLYVHGCFPEHIIDHIDRDPSNNRISNLREVSQQCNSRNCNNYKTNTSGVKGISYHKRDKKWQAGIKINRNMKHLGNYTNFDNVVCARLAGEQCLDWSGCDSNSPAYQYVKNNIQKKRR